MADQKRFQKVTLNSDDYKKVEEAAKRTKKLAQALGFSAFWLQVQLSMTS